MEVCNISIGEQNVSWWWKGRYDSPDDIRDEVEATVDRFIVQDGYFEDICVRVGHCQLCETELDDGIQNSEFKKQFAGRPTW